MQIKQPIQSVYELKSVIINNDCNKKCENIIKIQIYYFWFILKTQ